MTEDTPRSAPSGDLCAKFETHVQKALAASWEALPPSHRDVISQCLGPSSLDRGDLSVLYRFAQLVKPRRVVEVGLARGSSAVCHLLAAEDSIEQYIAIDPFQTENFRSLGVKAVGSISGSSAIWSLIEDPSYIALPRLLLQKHHFDYAFVDASHRFDDTLIEVYYIDRMLAPGGVIVLDDRPWPMVGAVVNFIRSNYVHFSTNCSHARLTFLLKQHEDQRRWYDFRHFEGKRPAETVLTI